MNKPGSPSVLVACALLLAGCHKDVTAPPSASTSPSAALPPASPPTDSLADAMHSADLRVEGRRGLLAEADPAIVKYRARLDAHFGGTTPFPLAFQAVTVESGKTALLLEASRGDPRTLVWLLDSKGDIAWTKEHPMGGVKPGASHPTLTPGPDGHVCLAWCNGSTDSVAFRRWADDGGAFADYDALHVDACDALSVLYWPGRGWLLGIAEPTLAVMQLINLNGERAWGNDGLALPWSWDGPATLSFALDTLDSVLMFRLGQSGASGSAEYLFASRWSADGRPMWPGPLSVKRLPSKVLDRQARVVLRPAQEGAIEATLAPGVAGPRVTVEVQSDGTVTRH